MIDAGRLPERGAGVWGYGLPKHTLAAVERLAEAGSEAPTDSKTSTGASEQTQLEPAYVQ